MIISNINSIGAVLLLSTTQFHGNNPPGFEKYCKDKGLSSRQFYNIVPSFLKHTDDFFSSRKPGPKPKEKPLVATVISEKANEIELLIRQQGKVNEVVKEQIIIAAELVKKNIRFPILFF